ncbi:Hypothetical predicted protein [Octopus vulgaris]|uniref:Uncharacterized protein n=1 Tax=Octopus vulgaris TaxID=6645 RepID=A0AA36BA89_OCTVU|nr:Hypothetical predicted protein [Octopus vulgaris]
MNGYDKLIQAAASRLIGYDSDLARYEVHKTVYMKQQLEDRYRSLEHMRLKNSLCANESSSSSMNKERIHSSETDIESYQLDNSCEEDRFSSSLNSPPSGPAAASSINNSRGHPDTPIPDGLPMVISRHGVGLLKTDMSNPDTSQLLREILQNKEKHQLSELAKNNNNNNNSNNNNNNNNNTNNNNNNNNNNTLNGTNTLQDSSGLITNLLKNSSQQQLKSNSSDVDKLSCHSTEGSAEESDGESTIEQMTNDEETDVGDVKGVIMSSGMDSQLIDSKEAKRARVENIITSIRHSPTHSQCDSQSMQEQRRQKRKQHQPQQHELSPEFQESKLRKIERDDLGRQLMELKNQLNDVQRKYTALCNAESSERTGEGHDDDDCHTATSLQSVTSRGSKLNGESNLNNRENIAFDNSDIDPVQLINHASQMVKEQEIATKRSTPLASMPLPSADVQGLASSLKSEIIHTVDTIVSRFVKNQALKSLENSSNETRTQDQGPKERVKSPVNNPEFPTDFYAIPRVHDKQTLYDTSCPSAPDLPRAHNRPLSFAPSHHSTPQSIPSYFAPPQVLTSPVYSSEPEQTEALSLVVNTPKKKRTKVTDTRLSPRAARALLQENCIQVPSAMADLDKHIAGSYPHILPQMLPTSVAIPNPSLQHSDILGYYREQNYLDGARSDGHSPSNDLGSPGNTNSLSEPYMMLKSEGFDVSSETDGSMALISFELH